MHTENQTFIHGPIDLIYEMAANVQNWPDFLPHYRYVRVLEQSADGNRKEVEMSAVRNDFPIPGSKFPARWRSIQICEPSERQVIFRHTGGIASGMWVVWEIRDDKDMRGIRVTIRHSLKYPFTALNGWFAKSLVGDGFVRTIAGQTLAAFKEIVETAEPPVG